MPTILIVDDEAQNLNALKRELQDRCAEWTILAAKSETEADSLLSQHKIDAVLTDLVMTTEQSGIDILRKAKAKDSLMIVIVVTAFEKHLDRYRAFELGAFDCIQKNTPGVIAAEEIFVKTKAALGFRDLTLRQIETDRRVALLRRYFDPGVFGVIEKSPELLKLRNQTVTVCFWDIRGFSRLCEILKAHPTLIAGFLQDYFNAAAECIFRHQGMLDKFIGDGVMGLFGALHGNADEGRQDAVNAVNAAIELRERFVGILAKWTEQWMLYAPQKIEIGLGCGIHTGEVLVGNVGTDMRDQFTALGPHVNLGQRIEALAGKGQILLSASTQARLKDRYLLNDSGVINDIKNIPGEYRLFSVEGAKS